MNTSHFLREAACAVADLMLPRLCVVCRRELLPFEKNICIPCICDLPLTHYEKVSRNPMADKLNSFIKEGPYAYATALFFHINEYRRITPSLKYGRNFEAGRFFSLMLGRQMATSPFLKDIDCIIPVPLHWKRAWDRGYNQAEIIAVAIAKSYPNAAVRCDLLKRTKKTGSQVKLNKNQRAENAASAFKATKKASEVSFRHILIVDDVFTTGSTLSACYTALKKALPKGSARISVATLSFDEEM